MLNPQSFVVDTNVWLNYFVGSQKEIDEICDFFEQCALADINLLYTPTTLKDVFYLIPRILRRSALSSGEDVAGQSFTPAAWGCVGKMTEIATAIPQSLAECDMAWMLRNTHNDFEDNLLMAAAETCGADYVVTYDQALLKAYAPACCTPTQAVNLFLKEK